MTEAERQDAREAAKKADARGTLTPEMLVREHASAVLGFCITYAKDFHDGEDIMQSVFLKAFTRIDTLRDHTRTRQWLLKIARRMRIDHFRRRCPCYPLADAEAAALDRDLSTLHQSDTDNAKRLVARADRNLIYVALDNWSTWDDKRYRGDVVEKRVTMVQSMAGLIANECQYIADEDGQEKRWKWSIASANANKVNGCLAMARPMMTVRPEALDSDTWLLNCEDGTLDLRTGHQRGVSKDDLITKLAPVVYDESATCPAWDAFLCDIYGVNMDADDIGSDAAQLVAFMKRAVGYSICGDTSEHCMFILHGAGRNGKSTFLETLAFVLGDYSTSTPADTFMVSENKSSGRNDLARLRGARLYQRHKIMTRKGFPF